MRIAVAQPRLTAPIAKCIKLLDITQWRASLLRNPFAQAAIKGSVANWIKGARGESGKGAVAARMYCQNQRLIAAHRNNCRRQTNLNGWRGAAYGAWVRSIAQARSSAKGAPS